MVIIMRKLLLFAIVLLSVLVLFRSCSKQESKCSYDSEEKKYIGKSADKCSRIKFACEGNTKYFNDECGCGCEKLKEADLQKNDCTKEQRSAEACIALYQPVCGWYDPEEIQFFRYPCANTFSNSCEACRNKNVVYWTDGECPK